jgi:hypothetical protein
MQCYLAGLLKPLLRQSRMLAIVAIHAAERGSRRSPLRASEAGSLCPPLQHPRRAVGPAVRNSAGGDIGKRQRRLAEEIAKRRGGRNASGGHTDETDHDINKCCSHVAGDVLMDAGGLGACRGRQVDGQSRVTQLFVPNQAGGGPGVPQSAGAAILCPAAYAAALRLDGRAHGRDHRLHYRWDDR